MGPIPINFTNFFSDYIFFPEHAQPEEQDKCFYISLALGILSIGIIHAVVGIAWGVSHLMTCLSDDLSYQDEKIQNIAKENEVIKNPNNAVDDALSFLPNNLKVRVGTLMEFVKKYPDHREVGSVKKDLFYLSTSSLYSSAVSPSAKANIVVMGMVHSDGVGDYYHILNAAEQIKKQFPNTKITMLVNNMVENLSSKVRKPIYIDIETIFRKWNQDYESIYSTLEGADQIIEMSQRTHVDLVIADIIKEKEGKYKFIGEYGHWDGRQAMGLKSYQLGIVIKDKPLTTSMLNLENEKLKEILFGCPKPSEEDLEGYLQTHEPFVGYLKMGSYYQMALIYTAAAYLKSSEKKVIDLIIPPITLDYLNIEFLKEQGVGKVKVIKIENGQQIEKEVIISEEGKEIRLIDAFPLAQQDFHTLLAHTNPLVGCTGDHSLSEVISFDRLPFYEIRPMKVEFQKDLIKLAGNIGHKTDYLKQYFQELSNIYDCVMEKVITSFTIYDELTGELKKQYGEVLDYFKNKQQTIAESSLKIANLLQHPEIFEEYRAFNELVRTQYSFNEMLRTIVERQLAFNSNPDLKNIENEIEENYLDGSISIYQANEQLAEEVKSLMELDD